MSKFRQMVEAVINSQLTEVDQLMHYLNNPDLHPVSDEYIRAVGEENFPNKKGPWTFKFEIIDWENDEDEYGNYSHDEFVAKSPSFVKAVKEALAYQEWLKDSHAVVMFDSIS